VVLPTLLLLLLLLSRDAQPTRSCFGNLEQVHNDVHNIMGGTGGDMA
jgi:hypothetical protein